MNQIILFCGLPLSGKSTLARILANHLKISHFDIDEIRHRFFQNPQEEMSQEANLFQMGISYEALFLVTESLSKLGRDIVISATFSGRRARHNIIEISRKNNAPIKAIYCHASDEIIRERLVCREKNKDSFSTCRTWEHYKEDKAEYGILPLPVLVADTSISQAENLERIIDFLKIN